MSDLISRRDALKAVSIGTLSAATVYGRSEAGMAAKREIERAIADLPSAQTEKAQLSREDTTSDCISRQEAIDAIERNAYRHTYIDQIVDIIKALPSAQHNTDYSDGYANGYKQGIKDAQPEIIRCKDCSKRPYCRMSTAWAVVPDDDWFCGDAERSLEEIPNDMRGEQE